MISGEVADIATTQPSMWEMYAFKDMCKIGTNVRLPNNNTTLIV